MWAILHGILSWIYIIYFALTRTDSERKKPGPDLFSVSKKRHGITPEDDGPTFRDFLETDPLAKHLDATEQMRRFIEWKNDQAK